MFIILFLILFIDISNNTALKFSNYIKLATEIVSNGIQPQLVRIPECTVLLIGNRVDSEHDGPLMQADDKSFLIASEAPNITNFRYSSLCTIALYFVRSVCELEIINDWWIWRIPGGILFSYHFIFINTREDNGLERKNRVMDLMHNFVTIVPSAEGTQEFEVAHPGVFWQSTMAVLGTWNSNSGALLLRSPPGFFLNRWKNYKGAEIIVARNLGLTEADVDNYREDFDFVTPLTPLYVEVYDAMNATFATLDPDPLVFGTKINGSWTGALKLIADGEAHLTIFMGINSYIRSELVVWSPMLFQDRVIFLIRLPKKAKGSLLLLATPFEAPVWALSITSMLLITIVLHVTFRRRKLSHTPYHWQLILRIVLDQSVPWREEYISIAKVKFIFGMWFFCVMVLSVGYKCKVVSNLVTPVMTPQPSTFSELAASHFQIGAISYNYGILGDLVQDRKQGDPVLQILANKIQPYEYRDSDCYIRILDEDVVCAGFETLLNPFDTWFLSDENGKALYETSIDHLFVIYASIGFTRKFPHVCEKFGRLAEYCMIAGLDIHWRQRVKDIFREHGKNYATTREITRRKRNKSRELSQLVIYLTFVLMLMVCLGLGAFVGELSACFIKGIHRRNSLRRENMPTFIYVR